MRFLLDSWRSDHAFPYDPEDTLEEPPAEVDVTVEAPAHEWAPIRPAAEPFPTVRFVDGVQASDAVLWIADPDRDHPVPGLAGSFAAGVLRCSAAGAELERVEIDRGVFSDARSLGAIIAGNLTWRPFIRMDHEPDGLRDRLGIARRKLEDAVGRLTTPDPAGPAHEADSLVVYDGLLHTGPRPAAAVGLAKRAYRVYLPPPLDDLPRHLAGGERSPLFAVTRRSGDDASRTRYSCYLALADPQPPAVADPGSCVARIEMAFPPGTAVTAMTAFADRVAATLPAYASEPHADPRAPQNLAPIRSLEQELRRLLGRPDVIRPLLAAEAAASQRHVPA